MPRRELAVEHADAPHEGREITEKRFAELGVLVDVYILLKTKVDELAEVKDAEIVQSQLLVLKEEAKRRLVGYTQEADRELYLELVDEHINLLIEKSRLTTTFNESKTVIITSLSRYFTTRINPEQAVVLQRSEFEVVIGVSHQELIRHHLKSNQGAVEVAIDVGGNRSFHIPGTPFIVVRLENGRRNGQNVNNAIRHEKYHNRIEGLIDNRLPSVSLETLLSELAGELGNFRGVTGPELEAEFKEFHLVNELQGELFVAILTKKEGDRSALEQVKEEVKAVEHVFDKYIDFASHLRRGLGNVMDVLQKEKEKFTVNFANLIHCLKTAYKIADESGNKDQAEVDLEALLVALDPAQYQDIPNFLKHKYNK